MGPRLREGGGVEVKRNGVPAFARTTTQWVPRFRENDDAMGPAFARATVVAVVLAKAGTPFF